MSSPEFSRGPLADITVLDLTRALAGPHASMMLGDLGARVIKVESPGGDDTRSWGPPFVGPDTDVGRISTYFLSCNRNKESVVLDLKDAAGQRALRTLIAHSDVLIENFRPGTLDRLGFTVESIAEINPRLITLSISGFGHDGPEGGKPGYDQIAQGEAGLMSITGPDADHPTKSGVPIADLLAGMYGAYGILAALHERQSTGLGRVIRTSLLAAVIGVHAFQGTRWLVGGELPEADGPHHPSICPYGLFRSSDGIIQIAVGSEGLWKKFAPAFDISPSAPGFATNRERVKNSFAVRKAVENAFASESTADLRTKLTDLGIPNGEVRNLQQTYDWAQTRSQGLVVTVDHPILGPIELPGPPLRFFDQTGSEWKREHTAPPLFGVDTETVLEWIRTADLPATGAE
jgi:crotonobetainyl-CoA:carnitine CoA-transferase CaiB-like acyl-CoA transferase